MTRPAAILYGIGAYLVFLFAFLYAIGFVAGIVVPKGIDDGVPGDPLASVVIDLALLTLFAVQHSVMARPGFKRHWTKLVPKRVERSTYVLLASLVLLLLFWQWRPLPAPVWQTTGAAAVAIAGLQALGWAIVLASTFMISHFDLFGLKQVFATWPQKIDDTLRTPMLYRYVRHPIYVGFIIAFWAAPTMSVGHLLFACATTAYILVGIHLEERDLITFFGDRYVAYRERVGMLVPRVFGRVGRGRTAAKA